MSKQDIIGRGTLTDGDELVCSFPMKEGASKTSINIIGKEWGFTRVCTIIR